jgi:hypothetical protein
MKMKIKSKSVFIVFFLLVFFIPGISEENKYPVKIIYGEVPLHSLEACRKIAEEWMVGMQDIDVANVLPGAWIGDPLIFEDLLGNPVTYEFPIINSGKEVGHILVEATGIEPSVSIHGLREVPLEEIKPELKATVDRRIPEVIEDKIPREKGCKKEDIVFLGKFLCTVDSGGPSGMFQIISTGEILLVGLYSARIVSLSNANLEQMQKETEEYFIKRYRRQLEKAKKKKYQD